MNQILTGILILAGSFFILVAAIGIIRFPDIYSRLHATTKATSFGILLIVLGVVLYCFNFQVLIKSILILAFIYLTAPLAAHCISNSSERKKD